MSSERPTRTTTTTRTKANLSRSSTASTLCSSSPERKMKKDQSRRVPSLHECTAAGSIEGNLSEKAGSEPIFVEWDGPDDPANPFNWSRRRKWIISSCGIMFCALVSLSVSAYSIAEASVREELDTSTELSLLGITTFTITFGAAPLLIAPLSEVYGRSYIYLASSLIFAIFFIPQALATNIETILITRFISGIAGSSAVSLVGGTLSDVWSARDRGFCMSIFSFAAFGSTGLGPIMFGYLAQEKGFRPINWIMFALASTFSIALIPIVDETRGSVLLSRKAAKLRKETGDDRYVAKEEYERGSVTQMMKTSLARPLRMLTREPVLIAFTVWISFTWGVLYLTLVSIPIVFKQIYGFNTGEAGLVYITQTLGSAIGIIADGYCNRLYLKNVAKRGPEARLFTAFVGGVCVPLGAFIYAFTAYPQCHWIGCCVGITILYVGMFSCYLSTFSYLADSYSLYASSALSAMSFVRNVVGAVFPLFTTNMYDSLGVQGAGGLTAGIGTLLSITPFILFRYGVTLRARSPFAKELARLEAEHAASTEKARPINPGPTASTNDVSKEEFKEIMV